MLAKGLRYHAGAGTQFTGLCAIPPVRIPYDVKKIRTRELSSYYFLWRSIRGREIAKRASLLAKRASALTVRGRDKQTPKTGTGFAPLDQKRLARTT